ncbi:LysE family translocator [Alloalcanivorax mobilis]|uniref:LysE family translocator n=1 Tax=Alloalcanivorax mobilis TaxID=2019569 RepID=UPI000B5B32D2|nr:LysE family translocator [Alloalcanivorax mobilis]ASK33332.1 lysine transporter LysE [Alcanivorax sp. N3-2A]
MDTVLPFAVFAFVASITPGPTNVLVLANASRHGLRATVPMMLGACAAAAGVVLLVGSGFAAPLAAHPSVQRGIGLVGLVWLSVLAWQLLRSDPSLDAGHDGARLGFLGAAGLQLVNPKVWMMALAVIGVFASGGQATRVAGLSLLFFFIALPCMGTWAWFGLRAARWIHSPRKLRRFNQAMALLLLVSAWLTVLV